MRRFVCEDAGVAERGGFEQVLEFRDGVGGADGGAVEAEHFAGIFAAVPANVEGKFQARRAAQIAEENCAVGFRETRDFSEKILGLGEMVEDGIAHYEVEARVGKIEAIAVRDLEIDAALETGTGGCE